jgi:hypothetical protein
MATPGGRGADSHRMGRQEPMSAKAHDKGSGKVDWERHSLKYVIYAINSAQKRQQKLWNAIARSRNKDGLVPVDWPNFEEYIESVRRTHSLMIDLETVGTEHDRKHGASGRARSKPARKPAARRKK